MANDVTTRVIDRDEATAEFVEDIAALLNRAFDVWPGFELSVSSEDHLDWKINGVLPGFPAAIIAELDGRTAGCQVVLVKRVLVKREPKLFVHFADTAVEPDLQGRGVYRAIQLTQVQFHPRYDLAIDDSSNETIVRGRSRIGTTHAFGNPVRPYVRPLRAQRFLRARSSKRMLVAAMALLLNVASTVTRLLARPRRGRKAGCSIRTVDQFDARFDEFCAEAVAPFDFVPERTAAFLNWRYADPRAGDFTIRVAERDGRLLGYVVTRTDAEITKVADILVAPGETSVAGALIADAVRSARELGSAAIRCWLPGKSVV